MSWPFTTPASGPTSFVGPGTSLTLAPVEVATGQRYLLGLRFQNLDLLEHTVTVTDSAGHIIWSEVISGESGSKPYSPTFEPVLGIKVSADDDAVVIGHVWGY